MYHKLGEVVLGGDLLTVLAGWNWKKPSANFPFLDTSCLPIESACPAARVSFAAAEEHH
jgi:hypothetical protein